MHECLISLKLKMKLALIALPCLIFWNASRVALHPYWGAARRVICGAIREVFECIKKGCNAFTKNLDHAKILLHSEAFQDPETIIIYIFLLISSIVSYYQVDMS